MTADDIAKAVKNDQNVASKYLFQYADRLSAHTRMDAFLHKLLAECSGAEDVDNLTFTNHWKTGLPVLSLYLKADKKDSALPRELVRVFGGRLEKAPSGDGLCCSGEYMRFEVRVYGYLPKTCRIEYREEYIPGHTARVPKVICDNGD